MERVARGRFERLMAGAGRDVAISRAVVRLIGTSVRISRALDEALSPAGLSIRQFMVLMELASSPDGTLSLTELMVRSQSSAPNMSALISRMERAGLVRKHRRADDQRLVTVAISEPGWNRLGAGAPLLIAAERGLARPLSRVELRELTRLLAKLTPPRRSPADSGSGA
jgi:DNA-binding MarR family transcriptional regulator